VRKPLCVDIYCGLGGWASGFIAEGFDVIGFDIERHVYGEHRYPGQLVIQDALTLDGAQFKDAACIVASPPCQAFSWMSMPWSLAKAKAAAIRADETGAALAELTRLFDACFRIQREACEAAGHHIPLVIENVRGAQPWVGRSRWAFGSFHLWGDVPALMPITLGRQVMKEGIAHRSDGSTNFHGRKMPAEINEAIRQGKSPARWTNPAEHYFGKIPAEGFKTTGMNWSDQTKRGQDFTRIAGKQAMEGKKCGGGWFGAGNDTSLMRQHNSRSAGRKAASAMIAKIPEPLSRWIARTYHP
jgi:hypothetical protein